MAAVTDLQRIVRLTPLDDVIAAIDTAAVPVPAQEVTVAAALGGILAEDVTIRQALPPAALALRDGWAVMSESTRDAGAYVPLPLPLAVRVQVGAPLPPGADAVAPFEAVMERDGMVLVLAPVGPGEGTLPAGGDVAAGSTLLKRGRCVTHGHAAALSAAGVERVCIREPRIRIARARPAGDAAIDGAIDCIGAAVTREGGMPAICDQPLAQAMTDEGADAIIVIGGTGSGENDATVHMLAAVGKAIVHGIALSPGETAAFGVAAGRPLLALPGRLDAALAVWHLLGRHLVARLGASLEPPMARTATLTHKIASTVGVSELVPVRCDGEHATPIASGYVPLAALAQADGWILVRPESEGYPAGSNVVVRPFP
jgi:molybdopterin biosynthesis enzyme